MKLSYDLRADALYIELTDKPYFRTQRITFNFLLDMDEAGEVIGIEVLNVRQLGIDPLILAAEYLTADQKVERPDPEAIQAGREALMSARQRQKAAQDT